jgi:hypothetical protein
VLVAGTEQILSSLYYLDVYGVDINESLDILKGVRAQIVIWTFYDQVVKVEKGRVEQ